MNEMEALYQSLKERYVDIEYELGKYTTTSYC